MRRAYLLPVALLVACAGLREADLEPATPPVDAAAPAADGDDAGARDSGGDTSDVEDAGPTRPRDPVCDGGCQVQRLASDLTDLGALTVDDSNVYASDLHGIYQCTKEGCDSYSILMVPLPSAWLAAGKQQIYYTDGPVIRVCPMGGCGGTPTPYFQEIGAVGPLVATRDRLVWRTTGSDGDRIRVCPSADCNASTATTIATAKGGASLAAGGEYVAWLEGARTIKACALDAGGTCAPKALGDGIGEIAIAGSTAFWVEGRTIVATDIESPSTPKRIARSAEPRRLVADGSNVYWRDAVEDHIYRCPLGGCGQPETVTTDITGGANAAIALDANYIYWTTKKGVFRRGK